MIGGSLTNSSSSGDVLRDDSCENLSVPLLELIRRKGRSLTIRIRRFVHHREELIRSEATASSHVAPDHAAPAEVSLLEAGELAELSGSSPYLTSKDLDRLKRTNVRAVVVSEASRIVAINLFVAGPASVYVDELGQDVSVGSDEHFSFRSYVDPDHRGRGLMQQLLHEYSRNIERTDRIWGLVMTRNIASRTSLHRAGRVGVGIWRAVTYFGVRRAHYEPLSPFDLSTRKACDDV